MALSRDAIKAPGWLLGLKKGADVVGILFFLVAFLAFIVQIFARYALQSPIPEAEEVAMIAFVWTVFWAAAFMVQIREHVTFDVVYDAVSDATKRWLLVFAMFMLVVAFVLLIPATWDYLQFLVRRRSPVMRIPMVWIYACYILFLVNFTIQALWRLWGLFGPAWTSEI